jgi:hypothetical protein
MYTKYSTHTNVLLFPRVVALSISATPIKKSGHVSHNDFEKFPTNVTTTGACCVAMFRD